MKSKQNYENPMDMQISSEQSNDLESSEVILTTRNFKRIQAVCEDAFNNKKMVAVVAEPGLGKTTSVHYFAQRKTNVFIVTARRSMTAKQFWIQLCNSIPGPTEKYDLYVHWNLHYILNRIVEKLLGLNDDSLLIIDECGKLTFRMYEHLHEIRDLTKHSVGIVLTGPKYFKDNLEKWARIGKVGMPEVLRRINYFEELPYPDRSEVRSYCKAFEIMDEKVIAELAASAQDFGTLYNRIVEFKAFQKRRKFDSDTSARQHA